MQDEPSNITMYNPAIGSRFIRNNSIEFKVVGNTITVGNSDRMPITQLMYSSSDCKYWESRTSVTASFQRADQFAFGDISYYVSKTSNRIYVVAIAMNTAKLWYISSSNDCDYIYCLAKIINDDPTCKAYWQCLEAQYDISLASENRNVYMYPSTDNNQPEPTTESPQPSVSTTSAISSTISTLKPTTTTITDPTTSDPTTITEQPTTTDPPTTSTQPTPNPTSETSSLEPTISTSTVAPIKLWRNIFV